MRLCAVSVGMGVTFADITRAFPAFHESPEMLDLFVLSRIFSENRFPLFGMRSSCSSKAGSVCGHDGRQPARAFHSRHRRKAPFPALPAWRRLRYAEPAFRLRR